MSSDDVCKHVLQHLPRPPSLLVAVEEMGIDAEGDLARGVAELAGDEGDVCPAGDQEAGEGVPEVMPPDRVVPGGCRPVRVLLGASRSYAFSQPASSEAAQKSCFSW